MFDLNPLEVLGKRSLDHIPPHFVRLKISEADRSMGDMDRWIKSKLKGRYAISQAPALDQDQHLKKSTFVAFEDQKELTYFMLACPYLRRN